MYRSSSAGIKLVVAMTDAQKNGDLLYCLHCPSRILRPNMASEASQSIALPKMTAKKKADNTYSVETDDITEWWQVPGIFDFENVGFAHTVDNKKYLACADCEMGPIGVHLLDSNTILVAKTRVRYTLEEP
eukprot:Clim_evm46s55 gene=Clim_evmTU46s55